MYDIKAEQGSRLIKTRSLVDLEQLSSIREYHPFSSDANDIKLQLSYVKDLNSAKQFLNHFIYEKNDVINLSKKAIKQYIIAVFYKLLDAYEVKVKSEIKSIIEPGDVERSQIIDELCEFYQYINSPEHKEILNIHLNPGLDKFLGKANTQTWQDMIGDIRKLALEVLLGEVESRYSERAVLAERFLNIYKKEPLFNEHRSNSFFNRFHGTTSVSEINRVIKEYKALADNELSQLNLQMVNMAC